MTLECKKSTVTEFVKQSTPEIVREIVYRDCTRVHVRVKKGERSHVRSARFDSVPYEGVFCIVMKGGWTHSITCAVTLY